MKRTTGPDVLGVDVGGVLIDRLVADGSDTSFFSDRYLETPQVEDAFATLARLAAARFGSRVYIVSKCGPRIEAKTKEWLAHHGFHERVGVPPEQLYFCRERRDKAPICAKLRVTHFIDDRADVLGYLTTVPHRFLFGPQEQPAPPGLTPTLTWRDAEAAIAGV